LFDYLEITEVRWNPKQFDSLTWQFYAHDDDDDDDDDVFTFPHKTGAGSKACWQAHTYGDTVEFAPSKKTHVLPQTTAICTHTRHFFIAECRGLTAACVFTVNFNKEFYDDDDDQ